MSGYAATLRTRHAYARLADVYDTYTVEYDYGGWLKAIEELINQYRDIGPRVLDVACGTGRSFEPLLQRGFEITACDISEAMVTVARSKFANKGAHIAVADMRGLPNYGTFDVITCLDDAINYMLDRNDLLAAFRSAERLLGPNGVYVFDTNSLTTYRTAFARSTIFEADGITFRWLGHGNSFAPPESLHSIALEPIRRSKRNSSGPTLHTQRHWSIATIKMALTQAGLHCLAVKGQLPGAQLEDVADEQQHSKIIFLAERAS